MTEQKVRHLTPGELVDVLLAGPAALVRCSDDFAHQHLNHDCCELCNRRLDQMIVETSLLLDGIETALDRVRHRVADIAIRN